LEGTGFSPYIKPRKINETSASDGKQASQQELVQRFLSEGEQQNRIATDAAPSSRILAPQMFPVSESLKPQDVMATGVR
jgi:hypothetical protein